jgi:hypothetical protein
MCWRCAITISDCELCGYWCCETWGVRNYNVDKDKAAHLTQMDDDNNDYNDETHLSDYIYKIDKATSCRTKGGCVEGEHIKYDVIYNPTGEIIYLCKTCFDTHRANLTLTKKR